MDENLKKENSISDLQKKIQEDTLKGELNGVLNPIKKNFNSQLQTLRTLKGDMEETVKNKHESVVSMAVKEVKVVEQEKKDESSGLKNKKEIFEAPRSNNILGSSLAVTMGSVFILVALLIFGVIYISKNNFKKDKVILDNSIIKYTDKKDINILDKNISNVVKASLISERVNYKSKVNSILYLNFLHNSKDVTSSEVVSAISLNFPDSIIRSLEPLRYMVGIYSFDTNEVFMVLKAEDFGRVYSSMLAFEPIMKDSLAEFFPNIDKSTFSNKESQSFKDEVYKNNDVRVLKNDKGETVLIYGFIDRVNLIITANEKIYGALVSKYINSQIVR